MLFDELMIRMGEVVFRAKRLLNHYETFGDDEGFKVDVDLLAESIQKYEEKLVAAVKRADQLLEETKPCTSWINTTGMPSI